MEKTVLITGASSGIGLQTAILFAEKGYKVFACVRKKSDKFRIEKKNSNIKGVYLDVTNSGGIDKAFWFVMKNVKTLDAIINCAGIAVAGPMEGLPIKKIKEQFEVNTFGTIAVVQKFLPLIQEGKVVYVSSMAASGIFPFLSPYCASKKATDIMLNSLFNEFKNDKIKFISVKPGCIRTPFWNKSVDNNIPAFESSSETLKEKYAQEMKFLAENAHANNYRGSMPQDVAETILKAVEAKKPKLSYTVGSDSAFTMFMAKFMPQSIINCAVKTVMKKRIEKISG